MKSIFCKGMGIFDLLATEDQALIVTLVILYTRDFIEKTTVF